MNRIAINGFLYTTAIFCVLVAVSVCFAQEGRYDAYSISFNTTSPSPGESVDAAIRSGSSSVRNIRSVRWYVDGEEMSKLNDNLVISEIVGNTPKQVVANIVYFDYLNQRKYTQVVGWIRPVIFDLFWEGDSVTIPNYYGHYLAGPQTPISVSAHIQYIDTNGILYSEKNFSFLWEVESERHKDSGPGVNNIIIEDGGTYFNNNIFIRVQASLINDSGVSFERVISIPITEPRVLIYSHTLLYGLFPYATVPRNSTIKKSPVTFSVYPFYFSAPDFEKDLIQYRWFVNNNTNHLKEGRKIDISLGGQSIPVPIRISINNENENLQKSEHSIIVNH